MPGRITIEEALRRGFWNVKLPSLALLLLPLGAAILASRLGWIPDRGPDALRWFGPAFLLAFGGGWLVWSVQVPRWRLWAYERVDDVAALKEAAVAAQLIWSEGSVFERTEIAGPALRARLRELEAASRLRNAGRATSPR